MNLYVDSDNAMGSPSGDIDDGFALLALIQSRLSIVGIASVDGNTTESLAYQNNQVLADLLGYQGKLLHGATHPEASRFLSQLTTPTKVLGLGPLTNFAGALALNPNLQISELIFVGLNYFICPPAWRFFDFNQWNDPESTRRVMESSIPLTCIPCDVARRLRFSRKMLRSIPEPLQTFFKQHSDRWFRRALLLKGRRSIPIWDLVAAMYVIEPDLFQIEETKVRLGKWGQPIFSQGRPIRVVTGYSPEVVWERFYSLLKPLQ